MRTSPDPPSNRAPAHRIAELDSLRGVAALWVVLFHFTFGTGQLWNAIDPGIALRATPTTFNFEGVAAVWLFFMVSGFVIFMTVNRCRRIKEFIVSRVARLYPAYWAAVVLTSALILAMPLPGEALSVPQFLANLTMLHGFIGFDEVDSVYWSLTFEVAFYAWISLLFLLGGLRRAEPIAICFVVMTMAAHHLLPGLMQSVPWRIQTLFLIPFSPLFLIGMIFYGVVVDRLSPLRAIGLLVCMVLFLWGRSLTECILFISIFGLFAGAVLKHLPLLAASWLIFLGRISYSLYLIHVPLGARAQLLLSGPMMPPWLNLLISIAVVLLAAAALNVWIEVPFGRYIRRRAAGG